MNTTKKYFFSFLLISLLIIFSNSLSYSQEMCHLVRLRVDKIKGKVVTNDEKIYPISSSKIELFEVNNNTLISSTLTDKDGEFEIENIKKGEYRLIVWATTEKGLTLFKYDVIVRVNINKNKESKRLLYIKLGRDCFDSDTKLIRLN